MRHIYLRTWQNSGNVVRSSHFLYKLNRYETMMALGNATSTGQQRVPAAGRYKVTFCTHVRVAATSFPWGAVVFPRTALPFSPAYLEGLWTLTKESGGKQSVRDFVYEAGVASADKLVVHYHWKEENLNERQASQPDLWVQGRRTEEGLTKEGTSSERNWVEQWAPDRA